MIQYLEQYQAQPIEEIDFQRPEKDHSIRKHFEKAKRDKLKITTGRFLVTKNEAPALLQHLEANSWPHESQNGKFGVEIATENRRAKAWLLRYCWALAQPQEMAQEPPINEISTALLPMKNLA